MYATGEIITIGALSYTGGFAANTHRIVIKEDRADVYIAWSEYNWFRTKGKMEPCIYPKYAWTVRVV